MPVQICDILEGVFSFISKIFGTEYEVTIFIIRHLGMNPILLYCIFFRPTVYEHLVNIWHLRCQVFNGALHYSWIQIIFIGGKETLESYNTNQKDWTIFTFSLLNTKSIQKILEGGRECFFIKYTLPQRISLLSWLLSK